MKIDPRQVGHMPQVEPPSPFRSQDGRFKGWKVAVPGQRPLATPAVFDGRVFLGGGFGGYEFYAFNAETGRLDWQYQTTDDGPTAAVVEEEFVVFNTESCELEVVSVDGRSIWKRWLGDPLMSMPAVGNGRVYMAYPDSQRDYQHYLAAFDLRTGEPCWKKPIAGEIITAPVLTNGHIYLTTMEGTLYCFERDGNLLWQEPKNATSSPMVVDGKCYFSRREEVTEPEGDRHRVQQHEYAAWRRAQADASTHAYGSTRSPADWLDHAKRKRRSPRYAAAELADAGVGFANHKGAAKIHQAMANLGHGHVSGVWAYQGSKPFFSKGRLYSPMGDTVHCVDAQTEHAYWTRKLRNVDEDDALIDHFLTPPALVNGKVFTATILGEVFCQCAESGEVLWRVELGEPVVFQPAVARGRVYVATEWGNLFCIETGDANDDGWLMWGATPGHNGFAG